jgi:hypothetical protein
MRVRTVAVHNPCCGRMEVDSVHRFETWHCALLQEVGSHRMLTTCSRTTDFETPTDWSTFPPNTKLQCATPDRLKQLYSKQLAVPGYRRLLSSNMTVFGTFDGR